jgi:predicted transposase/invertase (TIGR01784 family)
MTTKPKSSAKKPKLAPIASDGLFKKIMAELPVAREFLEHYLPDDFKELVDLSKITIEKETYVEDHLKRRLSDVVYSIKTKDDQEAFVYILVEHQSSVDHWISFRLWKYSLLLCERHINKQNNKLPLIVPMVFYHGSTAYNALLNLWDLFADPVQAKKLMTENYQLIDLQSMSDNEIQSKNHIGMFHYFMKHIEQKNMLKLWQQFLHGFKEALVIDEQNGYIYMKLLLWYTERKVPNIRQDELNKLIIDNLPTKDAEAIVGTIAEKYFYKGYDSGIDEGEARVKAQVARNLMQAGLSDKLIADSTGLSLDEIQQLRS